jgi:peptide/nickel transport system substrate-binding protein
MKKTYLLSLCTLTVVLLSACFHSSNTNNNNVFRYNESKGISSLDPAFAKNQTNIWPVSQLFCGLVQFDDSLHVKPCVAKKWEILDEGRLYRFTLRNDVYFHDDSVFSKGKGRRVVASDVVYTFARILNPKTASPGMWIFSQVDTARQGFTKGFRAVSDTVVEIVLREPFPAFLGILSMPYCLIVPREAVESYGDNFRRHPVGCGPFAFKYWKEGEKLILSKNPAYFETDAKGVRLPYIDGVAISFVADKQSEFLEFMKGNIDFISGVNPGFKDELITRAGNLNPKYKGRIVMSTMPYLNTEYFGFLCDTTLDIVKNSPLRKKEVRQAINYGFDREKMLLYLRNNLGYAATAGFVPNGLPSFSATNVKGYHFDPDKARQLLAQAGYPNGKGLEPITLMTTADYVDLGEYIQHELSNIGITLKIEISTGASFREMVANSKLVLFRGSWIADYPDAENYLALFHSHNFSPSGPNYFHFSNKKFDDLYLQSQKTLDESKRFLLYQQMDQLIIDEATMVPLFYDKVVRFSNPRLNCFTINPLNALVLKNILINR